MKVSDDVDEGAVLPGFGDAGFNGLLDHSESKGFKFGKIFTLRVNHDNGGMVLRITFDLMSLSFAS